MVSHKTHSPVETFPGLGASVRPSIAQHCHLVHQKVIAHRNPWDERYIYLHEWLICMVNVGRYTVHGCYGMGLCRLCFKHTFHLFPRVSFLLQVVFSPDSCSPSTSMVMGSSLGESKIHMNLKDCPWWSSQIFCYVHPYLGRWSNLTNIFFKLVETIK